jgi:hypothetical protein
MFGDVSIIAEDGYPLGGDLGSNEELHGYAEYRFAIQNHSPTTSHRVRLTLPRITPALPSMVHLRSMKRTVEVQPNEKMSVSLFQPSMDWGFGNVDMQVEIDGRTAKEAGIVPYKRNRGYWMVRDTARPPDLFSRSILTPARLTGQFRSNAFKSTVGKPPFVGNSPFGMTSGTNYPYKGKLVDYSYPHLYFFHEARVTSWSRHWLGYSGHDGVVLAEADLKAFRPRERAALGQYVECGGSLLILGSFRAPAAWNRTRIQLDGMTTYYPGFGQCLVVQETDINKWEPDQWHVIAAMWDRSARPWEDVQTPSDAQQRFPVVENIRIPVRTLFVVLLIFSLMIGPLNIYVLTRSRRRFWLLWTVPVVSFLTCAAVAGFMILSEGWQGYARIGGMTILDETTGRASSAGWLGLYPLTTPEGGLHFHTDTEITPHLRPERQGYRTGSPRTIEWTDDQILRSGWVTARMPAHFLVRSSERREEHLDVSKETDGSLTVVNALGVPIVSLWVADAAGKIYTASDISAGGKATLTATARNAAGTGARLREAYSKDWLRLVDTISAAPEEYLRLGCYLAVLDSAPFFQTGLRSAVMRPSRSVILGIMKAR